MVVCDDVFGVANAATARLFRALPFELLFVLMVFRSGRRTILSADFSHAENRLPALKGHRVTLSRGKAEAGGGEGSFGPAVVDAGEMPVYGVRDSIAVELIADVDEVLDACDVDIVDGGEVEDDGFQGGSVGFNGNRLAAGRAWVVPGAVLSCVLATVIWRLGWGKGAYAESGVERGVGAAGFFEDGGDHVVEIVVGVRVVQAFREAVDEDTRVW